MIELLQEFILFHIYHRICIKAHKRVISSLVVTPRSIIDNSMVFHNQHKVISFLHLAQKARSVI